MWWSGLLRLEEQSCIGRNMKAETVEEEVVRRVKKLKICLNCVHLRKRGVFFYCGMKTHGLDKVFEEVHPLQRSCKWFEVAGREKRV